jgi:hypothetical protein
MQVAAEVVPPQRWQPVLHRTRNAYRAAIRRKLAMFKWDASLKAFNTWRSTSPRKCGNAFEAR